MFSKPTKSVFVCEYCDKEFTRKDNLDRHKRRHVLSNVLHCEVCKKPFVNLQSLLQHKQTHQSGGKRKLQSPNTPSPKRLRNDVKKFYSLQKVSQTSIPKFNTIKQTYKVNIDNVEVRNIQNILETLKIIFQSLMRDIARFASENDLVRFSIQSPEIDYPISIPFQRLKDVSTESFLSEIERVLQSFEEFILNNQFEIDIIHVKDPKGGIHANHLNVADFLNNKRSIIRIQNSDNLCCARAIVTAVAKLENDPRYKHIRNPKRKIQGKLAKELHDIANVPYGKCGISEIKQFQAVLPNFQINVVSREQFNGIIYSGPNTGTPIYLYLHNDHFHVITSMPAFLNRAYYCATCQK